MWPFLPAPGKRPYTHAHLCMLLTSVSQGADDDGSGTVTILEAYRALLESDFKPNRTVEFHWYSAEVCPKLQSTVSKIELTRV